MLNATLATTSSYELPLLEGIHFLSHDCIRAAVTPLANGCHGKKMGQMCERVTPDPTSSSRSELIGTPPTCTADLERVGVTKPFTAFQCIIITAEFSAKVTPRSENVRYVPPSFGLLLLFSLSGFALSSCIRAMPYVRLRVFIVFFSLCSTHVAFITS